MSKFASKNMKKVWRSYKISILIVLGFLIIAPLVSGGTIYLFHQSIHGAAPLYITDMAALGVGPTCVANTSTNDYFIPAKTRAEWDAFIAHQPSQVTAGQCCGSSADCGTTGWESYRFSWPTIYGRYRTYSCNSGTCSSVLAAETAVTNCSQGWAPNSNTFSCFQQSCAGGKYSHDAVCTACPAGISTFTGYNTSCAACPAGFYSYNQIGSACTYCMNDYVCPGGTTFKTCNQTLYDSCYNPSTGHYETYGCYYGPTFSNGGCSTFDNCCHICDAGTYWDGTYGGDNCGACTRNYWCPGGGSRYSCGTNYYSATSSDAITDCYSA